MSAETKGRLLSVRTLEINDNWLLPEEPQPGMPPGPIAVVNNEADRDRLALCWNLLVGIDTATLKHIDTMTQQGIFPSVKSLIVKEW